MAQQIWSIPMLWQLIKQIHLVTCSSFTIVHTYKRPISRGLNVKGFYLLVYSKALKTLSLLAPRYSYLEAMKQ